MKFFKTKYRIVRDTHCGYKVQSKLWWWFWCGANLNDYVNTFSSVEEAEKVIFEVTHNLRRKSGAGFVGDVVKEINPE